MRKNFVKNDKGITLIALVITIIVMLILVAVTINIAVNGGLFSYAGKAAKDTELAKNVEQKLVEGQIEVGGNYYKTLEDFLEGKTSEKFSEIYTQTREYKEIINGVETVTAWIPKGFAVGTSEGINKVADGLVIQDDKGNQFVWIPVQLEGSTNAEKEASFDNLRTSKNDSKYSEPKTGEETGYNNMRTSVISKGGFYIGRFEAGFATGRLIENASVSTTVPLSKKGVYPYNVITWTDAKSVSENMYTDSTKYGVTSTLCYGVQWDTMLEFLGKTDEADSTSWGNYKNSEFNFIGDYYIYDLDEWKNDSTTKTQNTAMLLQTGATERNSLKNIYDVAGNAVEFTMEASSTSYRVTRGGWYAFNGGNRPASKRIDCITTEGDESTGFRVALYL